MVKLDNGISMPGEEILLRGLYELTSGEVQNRIAKEFGRDWTAQSRAFKAFIDIIFDNFSHLVKDNLAWWYRNGFWERSAAAIEIKMRERYVGVIRNMISRFWTAIVKTHLHLVGHPQNLEQMPHDGMMTFSVHFSTAGSRFTE